MTTRLLVPTDGSDPARAALEHALDIAADREAAIQLLYVADTKEPSLTQLGTDVVDVLEGEGDEILDAAAALAEDRGVSVETELLQGDPRTAIVDYATDEFDLVVMGAHGRRGIGEYVLGSTTDCVVNRSEIPVLTVRSAEAARRDYPYGDVLVPTDGSDHASVALEQAASIAARHDATLHLLSVVDELPEVIDAGSTQLPSQLEENVQAVLDKAETTAREAGVNEIETTITAGSVPREITSYVDDKGVDLVVMGTHGHTGLDRHLLGSFTERVIRTSPVPVLTTRRADELE